jgi:hypothetical protein
MGGYSDPMGGYSDPDTIASYCQGMSDLNDALGISPY